MFYWNNHKFPKSSVMSHESIGLDLDARAILHYLNSLGIRNISGEVLRDFITDLKKLIKYDQCKRQNIQNDEADEYAELRGPERLHSASTFSSRSRSKTINSPQSGYNSCHTHRPCGVKSVKCLPIRRVSSAPLTTTNASVSLPKRACSCTKLEDKSSVKSSKENKSAPSSSMNFIRVAPKVVPKKNDPVSLYHNYTAMWEKYKPHLPGENSWADLRWSIRQRLAGDCGHRPPKKVSFPTEKELEKRREAWID